MKALTIFGTILTLTVAINGCQKDQQKPNLTLEIPKSTTGVIDPSKTIGTGLVAFYPFNGNANDVSGNNNNGINYSATLTADRFKKLNSAYNFDGISNYIEVPSLNTLPYKPISYSLWIKPATYDLTNYALGGGRVIVGRDKSGYYYEGAIMMFNYPAAGIDNIISYYTGNSNSYSGFKPALNTWTHITMTQSSSDTVKWYINGTLKKAEYYTIPGSANIPFRIGAGSDVATGSTRLLWNGGIDDVRVYNRILTQSEITYLATH